MRYRASKTEEDEVDDTIVLRSYLRKRQKNVLFNTASS